MGSIKIPVNRGLYIKYITGHTNMHIVDCYTVTKNYIYREFWTWGNAYNALK